MSTPSKFAFAAACLLFAMCGPIAGQGIELAERYPATLESSGTGLSWVSDVDDVHRLSSFEFGVGQNFRVAGEAATLVLGRHGSNVLWAGLYPDEPATLVSKTVGDGETTKELFLRFAPGDLARHFPATTVVGAGDPTKRALATRLFRGKIGWRWSTPAGNTTVVPRNVLVVDCDTLDDAGERHRRCFALDVARGRVQYVAEFEERPLPPLVPITPERAAVAFDHVIACFDREYAKFARWPDLDWQRHAASYRERATAAATTLDFGAVLADCLRVLEDLHVWVTVDGTFLPGYARERPLNANFQGSNAVMGGVEQSGPNLWVGRTDDGIGYLNIHGLADAELPARVDAALERLRDTSALIVDLRFNGGGNEVLAQRIAGRFVDEPRVYAKHRFRAGEEHTDLGPLETRVVAPRDDAWRYDEPTLVLQGPVTFSSAEAFAAMLGEAPNVTTVGSATGGSSGNPRFVELTPEGIRVSLPRWVAYDAAGQPVEGVGFAPDRTLEFPAAAYTTEHDPLLEAALKSLR